MICNIWQHKNGKQHNIIYIIYIHISIYLYALQPSKADGVTQDIWGQINLWKKGQCICIKVGAPKGIYYSFLF